MSANPPQRLGKYELQSRLGQGGMAEVWKALDPQLKRYVAIKFLHAQLGSDPDFMVRFEREGQAIASLRHPNIVQVYDFQTSQQSAEGPLAYMVMDYVVGQTLADYIRSTSAMGKYPPPNQLLHLFTPICLAIDYAHQHGIIHRDIKPANILLDTRHTTYNPMGEPILTDFGIVKMMGAATLTSAGMSMGTPLYISPEQVQGQPGDERSDIYSLGVMLFEMCTGTPPFHGGSPYTIMMQHTQATPPIASNVNPQLGPAMDDFLFRCLAKKPEARFPSAASMAVALAQALSLPIPEQLQHSVPSLGSDDVATEYKSFPAGHGTSANDQATLRAGVNNANTAIPAIDNQATLRAEVNTSPGANRLGATPIPPTGNQAAWRAEANTPPGGSQAQSNASAPPLQPVAGAERTSSDAPLIPTPPRPPNRQRRNIILIVSAVVLLALIGSGLAVFLLHSPGNTGNGGAGGTGGTILGHAVFTSSRQLNAQGEVSVNDGLQVTLQHVSNPGSGNHYYAWLQDSQVEAISAFLGVLNVNQGAASLTYNDPQHRDLLASMTTFLVTEESASVTPNTPSLDKKQWRYYATLPQTPSPKDNYSYLDHVRHLLAGEPALDKLGLHQGIAFWFLNSVEGVQKSTIEVRDHANLLTVRQQLANILYYLDGPCAQQDLSNAPGVKTPENNIIAHNSAVGLLDCPSLPIPGHVTHIGSHLGGVTQAPDAPADQIQRAIEINKNMSNIKAWLNKVHADALQLVNMDDTQLQGAQTLRSDIALQANYVLSGGIDPVTQAPVPSAAQIVSTIGLLSDFNVTAFKG